MNNLETTLLFLITGIITAAGTHEAMPILHKTRMKIVNKQYLEAIFTAEQIVDHYPNTVFAASAREIIDLINQHHLDGEYTASI